MLGLSYTVQPGDTLATIAARIGADPAAELAFIQAGNAGVPDAPAPGTTLHVGYETLRPDILARFVASGTVRAQSALIDPFVDDAPAGGGISPALIVGALAGAIWLWRRSKKRRR